MLTTGAAVTNVTALAQVDREKIYQWINELSSPETRENALLELSKKRESVPDLAPMLWHSFGTIAALLQVSSSALTARFRLTGSETFS
uniref:CCR4-NOT transcription complex subunit 9 n=1 Tax=Fundulus heteroclitus TaxID=8078 RepID=A0A3Q2NNA3_FUNHE